MFTVLYWIFCFSFAFDFRGEKGGSAVQYVFLAFALLSGVLIILSSPSALRSKPTSILSAVWWLYLGTTVLVAAQAGIVPSQYFRCLLPPLLFGISLLVGQCLVARHYSERAILWPLLYAGMVSVLWRFVHAIIISKIPVDQVRYEMLSPAIPLLFAVSGATVLLSRQIQPLPLIGGALALASVLISVTRSYIFTLAAAIVGIIIAFLVTVAANYWHTKDLRRKLLHVITGAVLAMTTLLVLYFIQPHVFERWFERLFFDGGGRTTKDVTYLTRAAEAKAIWQLLEADPMRFIYGKKGDLEVFEKLNILYLGQGFGSYKEHFCFT